MAVGDQQLIPWPDPITAPWDTPPGLPWLPDGEEFAVVHWRDTWVVGFDGAGFRATFGGPDRNDRLAVDPDDGVVVDSSWQETDLTAWEGQLARSRVDFPYGGERFATRHGLVAFTGGGGGLKDNGPVVLDVATGGLVAYAPIRDFNAVYSDNGHVTAQGFLDRDTVLILVGPADFRSAEPDEERWYLVAWHFDTGDFERLASGDTQMREIAVAADVLGADWDQ